MGVLAPIQVKVVCALAKKKKKLFGAQPKKEEQAPPKQEQAPPQYIGRVPPQDAFDSIKRRPPPPHLMPEHTAPPIKLPNAEPKAEKTTQKRKKAPQKPANPTRRRRRRRAAAVLGLVAVIAGGVWLSVMLLFNIEHYELQGDVPYTVQQLADVFGHAIGDNMYGFSSENAQLRITQQLPYIEQVRVRRQLPSTIVFEASAAQEAYYLEWQGEWAVLSSSSKVLRITSEEPQGLVRIDGLIGLQLQEGMPLALNQDVQAAAEAAASQSGSGDDDIILPQSEQSAAASDSSSALSESSSVPESTAADSSSESTAAGSSSTPVESTPPESLPTQSEGGSPQEAVERLAVLQQMLQLLSASELQGVSWINVQDTLSLSFGWDERITVLLGTQNDLEQKLETVVVLLSGTEQERIGPADRGTLDMRYYIATGRSYFSQE